MEKLTADETHGKFKSQMVAHGNERDAKLYPDHASPTAQLHSIMACLAVAVCNKQCITGKLDVEGLSHRQRCPVPQSTSSVWVY
jgi:hypothetical protein